MGMDEATMGGSLGSRPRCDLSDVHIKMLHTLVNATSNVAMTLELKKLLERSRAG